MLLWDFAKVTPSHRSPLAGPSAPLWRHHAKSNTTVFKNAVASSTHNAMQRQRAPRTLAEPLAHASAPFDIATPPGPSAARLAWIGAFIDNGNHGRTHRQIAPPIAGRPWPGACLLPSVVLGTAPAEFDRRPTVALSGRRPRLYALPCAWATLHYDAVPSIASRSWSARSAAVEESDMGIGLFVTSRDPRVHLLLLAS